MAVNYSLKITSWDVIWNMWFFFILFKLQTFPAFYFTIVLRMLAVKRKCLLFLDSFTILTRHLYCYFTILNVYFFSFFSQCL